VGCKGCRDAFRKALVAFLESKRESLCSDCEGRLDRNPLRIFDCKNEQCGEAIREAPVIFDYLCDACREHFDGCLSRLDRFGVPYLVNKRLVRGLDYYTRTVFEFTSPDLGAQKAFAAGGRYDNLVEEMGGPSVPGIGLAIGMERLAQLIPAPPLKEAPLYFLATVGERAQGWLIPLLEAFVSSGTLLAYAQPARSLKSQLKYANSIGADYALILADEEASRGVVILRNMKDGGQRELPLDPAALPRLVRE
jgi:histidyl-tRNA synthetase